MLGLKISSKHLHCNNNSFVRKIFFICYRLLFHITHHSWPVPEGSLKKGENCHLSKHTHSTSAGYLVPIKHHVTESQKRLFWPNFRFAGTFIYLSGDAWLAGSCAFSGAALSARMLMLALGWRSHIGTVLGTAARCVIPEEMAGRREGWGEDPAARVWTAPHGRAETEAALLPQADFSPAPNPRRPSGPQHTDSELWTRPSLKLSCAKCFPGNWNTQHIPRQIKHWIGIRKAILTNNTKKIFQNRGLFLFFSFGECADFSITWTDSNTL